MGNEDYQPERYALVDKASVGVVKIGKREMERIRKGSIVDLPDSKSDLRLVVRQVISERVELGDIIGTYVEGLNAMKGGDADHRARILAADKLSELIGIAPKSQEAVVVNVGDQRTIDTAALSDDQLRLEVQKRIAERRGAAHGAITAITAPKYGGATDPPPGYSSPGFAIQVAASDARPVDDDDDDFDKGLDLDE